MPESSATASVSVPLVELDVLELASVVARVVASPSLVDVLVAASASQA
jgi:hypothetical protein